MLLAALNVDRSSIGNSGVFGFGGLLLAWELNIKELMCYSDFRTAIKLIILHVDEWHHYTSIIYNIKDILARDCRVKIVHTFWEDNACADYLAKYGARNN
ncbi:ribonuclease H [Trifolium pratense]|uniref:Ribonuclease H n=1 Tax=Trifolium pratense TaxID=57577 RepID=A0A2K3P046_TRIPR|nr:ribonuclease H [Trifolium pratense]